MSQYLLNAVLRQSAAECADFVSIIIMHKIAISSECDTQRQLCADSIHVGRFAEGARARDFPLRV